MSGLDARIDSLMAVSHRSYRDTLVSYKQWCHDNLTSSERSTLSRKISYMVISKDLGEKARELINRSDSSTSFCEPFHYFPRVFRNVVIISERGVTRSSALSSMGAISGVDLVTQGSGGENYTYDIGSVSVVVTFNSRRTNGLTVAFGGGDEVRAFSWPNSTLERRMRLKGVFVYILNNRATYINFTHSKLAHSRGWYHMVTEILAGALAFAYAHTCTVAGVATDEQLNYCA
jgi:hypothetical protein